MNDPRAGNARHNLLELIFVALAAVLCGAEDCTDMAEFARTKLSLLPQVVNLEHGPPSLNTLSRVFRLLDPEPFEAAFARFFASSRRARVREPLPATSTPKESLVLPGGHGATRP